MIELLGAALGANNQPLAVPTIEYSSVLPQLILAGGAILLLLFSSLMKDRLEAKACAFITVVLGVSALVASFYQWRSVDIKDGGIHSTFAGSIADDHFAIFFTVVICSALILSALISSDWLEARRQHGPEFFILMLMSASGAILMGAANDLVVIFLGLEILSIALYVLVGLNRRNNDASSEAAIKYFILGGFSSAIFLYGIALTYGAVGSTNLSNIALFLSQNALLDYGILLGGMALLAVGFGFKVAAVPFHQWTPDVYQGAPTPVTAFMAAAAKAGAFAAFLRVFGSALYPLRLDWEPIILALAILTLLVGSIVACVQQNVIRMLAYSSISHAGYILLGLQAASLEGISGALFYVLAYTFMVAGTFAIVSLVGGQDDSKHGLEAFKGLAHRNPAIALSLTVLLLAQAGVPLTSGFLAKFYVVSALVQNGSYATAVFGMVIAAVAAYFYLRIVIAMYSSSSSDAGVEEAPGSTDLSVVGGGRLHMPAATQIAVGIALLFTIGMGIIPPGQHLHGWFINTIQFARLSAADFFKS